MNKTLTRSLPGKTSHLCITIWVYLLDTNTHIYKGNKSWIFIGRTDAEAETPILWLPDAKNSHWKRPWCWTTELIYIHTHTHTHIHTHTHAHTHTNIRQDLLKNIESLARKKKTHFSLSGGTVADFYFCLCPFFTLKNPTLIQNLGL